MTGIDLSRAEWQKSSHSGQSGNCVEVARNLPGLVAVRDSKDTGGARAGGLVRRPGRPSSGRYAPSSLSTVLERPPEIDGLRRNTRLLDPASGTWRGLPVNDVA